MRWLTADENSLETALTDFLAVFGESKRTQIMETLDESLSGNFITLIDDKVYLWPLDKNDVWPNHWKVYPAPSGRHIRQMSAKPQRFNSYKNWRGAESRWG